MPQHGFLPGCSTLTQLLFSPCDWFESYSRNAQTDLVCVDFSKAFDTVCHAKHIFKLEAYGVSGALLRWLRSFLNGRSFAVNFDDILSNALPVCSSASQKNVLGPFLFLIYINDLPGCAVSTCKIFVEMPKLIAP